MTGGGTGAVNIGLSANVPRLNGSNGFSGTNTYSGSNTFTGTFSAPLFNSTTRGLVPLSGGGTANFLRADGTWQAPGGSGTVTSITCGTGLTGGTITSIGTCGLDTSRLFTAGASGLTPASGGGTANFLRADGTWSPPSTLSGLTTVFDVVRTYGGDPTGTNDNTTAYNSAKAACLSGPGGIIYFGAGAFKFTSNITLSGACNLEGAGRSSTIFKPTGITGNFLTHDPAAYYADIGGFQIQNGGSWTSGFAINCCGSSTHVHDIFITGTPQGLYHSTGSDVWFDHMGITVTSGSVIVRCDNGRGNIFGSRWSYSSISGDSGSPNGTGFQAGTQCNTPTFNNVDILFTNTCLLIPNGSGPIGVIADDLECDGGLNGAIFNDGSGIQLNNSFFSDSSVGHGVAFGTTFTGFAILTNNHIRDNTSAGIENLGVGGQVLAVGNVISGNATGNIVTAAGVTNFSYNSNFLQVPGAFDPTSAYAVFVGTGASNYYSIQNNVCYTPSLTNTIVDGGSGVRKIVGANPGCN